MESRYNQFIKDVSNSVVANFSIEIPHNNKTYNLKLSYAQTNLIREEIDTTLNSIELSGTQKRIIDTLFDKFNDEQLMEFKTNLIGHLSFADHFSLFSKYEKVKKNGLTGLYYDNLLFELDEFDNEKLFNTFPMSLFGSAKSPGKDLQMRFNKSTVGARPEFLIAVYCIALANFATHDEHLALANELKDPDNKIIAAIRKPYGAIAFFSSAKEINSKAYFAYQHHVFAGLLGGEVLTQATQKGKDSDLVFDVGRKISFLFGPKEVNNLARVNRKAAAKAKELREEYAEIYYRKRV